MNEPAANGQATALRRTLGLPILVLYGVGTILGAGIYVVVGEIAGRAGTAAPLSFLLAGVVALATGASMAELVSRFPSSAGEAVYVQQAFGRRWLSTLTGGLVGATGIISAATIASGFAGYARVFVDVPPWLASASLLLFLGAVAIWGIRQSVTLAAVGTVIEVVGLLIVIYATRGSWGEATERLPEMFSVGPDGSWWGVIAGAFIAFYAFIGFEDLVNVAEEVKKPERNLPKAIFISIGISTLLYLVVAVVAVAALDPQTLRASSAPLAEVYQASSRSSPWLISAIGMIAVANGAIVQIVMSARVAFGLAQRGWIPGVFGSVWEKTKTPVFATVVVTSIMILLATLVPLARLAEAASFAILVVFGLVNAALAVVHRTHREVSGSFFSVPRFVPLIGTILCISLLVLRTIDLMT